MRFGFVRTQSSHSDMVYPVAQAVHLPPAHAVQKLLSVPPVHGMQEWRRVKYLAESLQPRHWLFSGPVQDVQSSWQDVLMKPTHVPLSVMT